MQWTTDDQCQAVLSMYLIEMGIPFNKADCKQFRACTKTCCLNNKTKHLGRDKYNDHINHYCKKFKQAASK
eukprot:13727673-Ditylum_brightwellii.AAC.1